MTNRSLRRRTNLALEFTLRSLRLVCTLLARRSAPTVVTSRIGDVPEHRVREKVFVTGVYGSGKTYFAKAYAAARKTQFISFDQLHDYSKTDDQAQKLLNHDLPSAIVMHAIPINEDGGWRHFSKYEANNEILVVCVYCPDEEWIKRAYEKKPDRSSEEHFGKYREFCARLPDLQRFKNVLFYDSSSNEFTSGSVMAEHMHVRFVEV